MDAKCHKRNLTLTRMAATLGQLKLMSYYLLGVILVSSSVGDVQSR
jgi:hypothetical protein